MKGLRDRAIITVLRGCSPRRSEVARLRWSTYALGRAASLHRAVDACLITITKAPSATRANAIANPMPPAETVTSAVLPFSC